MKNYIFKIFLSFFFIIMLVWGCKKVSSPNNSSQFSVQTVKNWFNSIPYNSFNANNSDNNPLNTSKAIDWNNPFEFKIGEENIVEFPITLKKNKGLSLKANSESIYTEKDVTTLNRMVFKENANGIISAAVMIVIPNSSYLNSRQFNLSGNHYKNLEKDFSGIVLFYSWDGNYIGGWGYSDGKITKKLYETTLRNKKTNSDENIKPLLTDPTHCTTTIITQWCINCTDWFVNGVYSHTSCGNIYECGQYQYTECDDPGAGGTGGGGGSGGGFTGPWDQSSQVKLCGTIAFKSVGNSWTGGMQYLQTIWSHPQQGTIITNFANACISIPSYGISAAVASTTFQNVYNASIQQVVLELNEGLVLPNAISISSRLKTVIQVKLWSTVTGATFSSGPCLGNIPVSQAQFCPISGGGPQ